MPVMPAMPAQKDNRPALFLYAPNVAAINEGWEMMITPAAQYPVAVRIHLVNPMPGQAHIRTKDGRILERTRPEYIACLGSPRAPFVPTADGQEPVLDPAGVEICQSIMLPGGIPLHDTPLVTRFDEPVEWRYSMPAYNWSRQAWEVVSLDWVEPMAHAIFRAVYEHNAEEPLSYVLRITGFMEAGSTGRQKKAYKVDYKKLDNPIALPPDDDERWMAVRDHAYPFRTPEAVVQRLGIEQFNPQYVKAGARSVASPMPSQPAPRFDDSSAAPSQPASRFDDSSAAPYQPAPRFDDPSAASSPSLPTTPGHVGPLDPSRSSVNPAPPTGPIKPDEDPFGSAATPPINPFDGPQFPPAEPNGGIV